MKFDRLEFCPVKERLHRLTLRRTGSACAVVATGRGDFSRSVFVGAEQGASVLLSPWPFTIWGARLDCFSRKVSLIFAHLIFNLQQSFRKEPIKNNTLFPKEKGIVFSLLNRVTVFLLFLQVSLRFFETSFLPPGFEFEVKNSSYLPGIFLEWQAKEVAVEEKEL